MVPTVQQISLRPSPGLCSQPAPRARARPLALSARSTVSDGSCSVPREVQEREKALRLQKEKLQKELEEKKRKVPGGSPGGL